MTALNDLGALAYLVFAVSGSECCSAVEQCSQDMAGSLVPRLGIELCK